MAPEIAIEFPKSIRGTRKMQDTTLTEMMTTAVAAIRAESMAEHLGIASQSHEAIREPQPGSEIPPWTTNQLRSQS